jgi:mannose/fructose/N-acetylgalactosamine-specific phosphotransferase system component IIB
MGLALGYDQAIITDGKGGSVELVRWTRLDERLIHGQVITAWRQHLGYKAICVVDDAVAGDPYLSDALRLAVPAGIEVSIYAVREAVDILKEPPNVETLLLIRSPRTALALVEAGISLSVVNVGNVAARSGSKRVLKSISLTVDQAKMLDALVENGIEISFQVTPEDPPMSWQKLRRRVF